MLKSEVAKGKEDKRLISNLRKEIDSLEQDLISAKNTVDNLRISRDHINPPKEILRAKTSIVNSTNNPYNTRSRCSSNHYSFKNKENNEIMIDEVRGSEQRVLKQLDFNRGHQNQEIQKLKSSLQKAVKKSSLWQSKFYHLKEKIYRQTQKMTEEINKTRRHYDNKLKTYFKKYTKMLKEIVVSNSQVKKNFLNNFKGTVNANPTTPSNGNSEPKVLKIQNCPAFP
jgi:hypothetical protein